MKDRTINLRLRGELFEKLRVMSGDISVAAFIAKLLEDKAKNQPITREYDTDRTPRIKSTR